MVWFQCEDCGENLKKPKLAGHFRSCSAYKLSCIDCGDVFTQEAVQSHTQCISESEKYGPKGQNRTSSNAQAKPEKLKPNTDVDVDVGLSTRPPWFCSLCNTTTTSKQTLLLHADGKKHRAKAKAFHASQKQSNGAGPTSNQKGASAGVPMTESALANGARSADCKESNVAKDTAMVDSEDDAKRKRADSTTLEVPDNAKKQNLHSLNNGEVIQSENGKPECKTKGSASSSGGNSKEAKKEKIKWKKILTKTLKKNPDRVMKLKKLQKLVIQELQEAGLVEDKEQLRAVLMDKITSSSRFSIDGKCIRLVAKDEES